MFRIIFVILVLLLSSRVGSTDDTSDTRKMYADVATKGVVPFRITTSEKRVPLRFQMRDHKFPFETDYVRSSGPVRIFKVRFPSPVKSELDVNNTVHAHYFQPKGQGPFPAVVVIHILGGEFPLSQMVANGLARRKVAALFIKLPYYGERRGNSRLRYINFEPDITQRNFTQAVLDIRRAAAWLGARPEVDSQQLGITGISLGGIMSALAGPVEPRFKKIAIYLGGGNLGEMVWKHPDRAAVAFRASWKSRGGTRESFLKKVRPVDPLTYGYLLKERTVLMVAAKHDEIVPPEATKALWESAGRKPKLVWLDCGHITAALFLFGEMKRIGEFFQPNSKPSH